jgi:hypothetical protein
MGPKLPYRPSVVSNECHQRSERCLAGVVATAIATECVIGSVRGDHEAAANQCNENFRRVRWKVIAPIRAPENEGQAKNHEYQHAQRAVPAVAPHQGNDSKSSSGYCKGTMRSFF